MELAGRVAARTPRHIVTARLHELRHTQGQCFAVANLAHDPKHFVLKARLARSAATPRIEGRPPLRMSLRLRCPPSKVQSALL